MRTPPIKAWAVGFVPAAGLIIVVFAFTDSGFMWLAGPVAFVVMRAVAAAVWPSAWEAKKWPQAEP